MTRTAQKVLGSGFYKARREARSTLVRLTATGLLPCSNYTAQLEMRPERVVPPMWDLVFFVEESCEKALKVFAQEVVMLTPDGAASVIVHDAAGIHEVPILAAQEMAEQTAMDHVVYARFPMAETGHHGCVVASVETMMSAYYYVAFGPATREECERFIHNQPAPENRMILASGEVPWPLMV